MGASLKDVARLAGVSVKTVSNVVHGYAHVTDSTRARVQRALDELNYRPNVSARNLRQARSGIIALALPDLGIPYFSELASLVIAAAEAQSWTVLVDQTDGRWDREQRVVEGIRAHLIDGLIFSPLAMDRDALAVRVDDTPLVLLGERVVEGTADHVAIDNRAAAEEATGHLIDLGRRRVAAIGDQLGAHAQTAHLRLDGYRRALRAAGLPLDPDLVRGAPSYHRADGAAAAAELLRLADPPDAIFCFNDLLALGALRTLRERGYRVPEDVALVGFDDIEDGRFSMPSLTTVAPDKRQIAEIAVSFLLSRIERGAQTAPRDVRARHQLMIRETTVGYPTSRIQSAGD